ncbi:MAG: RNHCP domain-containing protein, partial [Caldithrix sp.]|nr:RNHCP domain-containing protein [Caldithrix sp.]
RKEDFVCENCGEAVKGDGYTNHCPHCLHSKHVDINPGDRLSKCGGMMKPASLEKSRKGFTITFVCEKCGQSKKNRTADNDDMDTIIEISKGEYPGKGR